MEIRARCGAEGAYDRNEPLARRGVAPRTPARSQPQGGRVDEGTGRRAQQEISAYPKPQSLL